MRRFNIRFNTPLDVAFGSLFALAAAAFGVVGFIIGLKDNPHTTQWFVAALVLGVLSGGVLLDEAHLTTLPSGRGRDAWVGTALLGGALGLGTVGFVLGLVNKAHAMTWLVSGLVLAILSLTATIDEIRLWRVNRSPIGDAFFGLGFLFGLLGLAAAVVGFILGLMSRNHADTWLWAGVISSVVGLGWSFEAEHRTALAEHAGGPAEITDLNSGRAAQP